MLSGAVALMSLSVKSSLADEMSENGRTWATPLLSVSFTVSPSRPSSVPANCLRLSRGSRRLIRASKPAQSE